MPRSGPRVELRRLTAFVQEVEERYLAPHAATVTLAAPSRNEMLDVAAFVVLTHGAFERFVESLTIWITERVVSNWINKRRLTRSTAALLFRSTCKINDDTNTKSTFDVIRDALDHAKRERSSVVYDNNGIELKNLRRLLAPLGVDVPNDPVLIGSLDSLVSMRHEWAHQRQVGAKSTKGAADVKKEAKDCIDLAKLLSSSVKALRL